MDGALANRDVRLDLREIVGSAELELRQPKPLLQIAWISAGVGLTEAGWERSERTIARNVKTQLLAVLFVVACQAGPNTVLTNDERLWCRESSDAVYAVLLQSLSTTTPDGEPMLNWIEDAQLMQWVVGGDSDAAEADERYRAACRAAYSDR